MARFGSPLPWMLLGVAVYLSSCTKCASSVPPLPDGGKAKGKHVSVESGSNVGEFVSLHLDASDAVHLAYYDRTQQALKYARQTENGFAVEVVEANCAKCVFSALELNAQGEPGVAYFNGTDKMLMFAMKVGQEWKKETVEWGAGTGMGIRLLYDQQGKLHALYYSGDGYLKHAWREEHKPAENQKTPDKAEGKAPDKAAGKDKEAKPVNTGTGLWGAERVDRANGSEKVLITLMEQQPQGGLAASYLHWSGMTSELKIAYQRKDQGWTSEVVTRENNPGKSSALFVDSGSGPQILYRESMTNNLVLTRFSQNGWEAKPLCDQAFNMAFATNGKGLLLLAFSSGSGTDARDATLRLALSRQGSWTLYSLSDTPGSGAYLDAAVSSHGQPIVAYHEESTKSLKVFVGE